MGKRKLWLKNNCRPHIWSWRGDTDPRTPPWRFTAIGIIRHRRTPPVAKPILPSSLDNHRASLYASSKQNSVRRQGLMFILWKGERENGLQNLEEGYETYQRGISELTSAWYTVKWRMVQRSTMQELYRQSKYHGANHGIEVGSMCNALWWYRKCKRFGWHATPVRGRVGIILLYSPHLFRNHKRALISWTHHDGFEIAEPVLPITRSRRFEGNKKWYCIDLKVASLRGQRLLENVR